MLQPLPPPPDNWSTWAQIVGPILTFLAVIAAWRSAGAARKSATASLKTADRADETSRRAMEALARTIRPNFRAGLQTPNWRDSGPQPVKLHIENLSPHPGLITNIQLRSRHRDHININRAVDSRIDGRVDGALPAVIIDLGNIPRAKPDAKASDITDDHLALVDAIDWAIEFTDEQRLATWTQSGTISEYITRAGGNDINFVYGSVTTADIAKPPQLVARLAPAHQPTRFRRLRASMRDSKRSPT